MVLQIRLREMPKPNWSTLALHAGIIVFGLGLFYLGHWAFTLYLNAPAGEVSEEHFSMGLPCMGSGALTIIGGAAHSILLVGDRRKQETTAETTA